MTLSLDDNECGKKHKRSWFQFLYIQSEVYFLIESRTFAVVIKSTDNWIGNTFSLNLQTL